MQNQLNEEKKPSVSIPSKTTRLLQGKYKETNDGM